MPHRFKLAGIIFLALFINPAFAESVFWGVQADRLEYRAGGNEDVFAWDFDALVGTDELRFVWRSEAEFSLREDSFESLENQARVQVPISDFFDAIAGLRIDTPAGPNRVYGIVGVSGLAPQWFEIEADLFISPEPVFRFEAEYEVLISNRIILTPAVEMDLPLRDDVDFGLGAWGPKIEAGVRLSYDLIDRAVSPYVGLHYERAFGKSADLVRDAGNNVNATVFVVGVQVKY